MNIPFLSSTKNLQLSKIRFEIDKGANDDSGTMVHLLIFFNKDLMGSVSAWPAKDYFKKYNNLKRQFQGQIKIMQWSLAAKKGLTNYEPIQYDSSYADIAGAIIFASYHTKGNHMVPIPAHAKTIAVHLKKNFYEVNIVE